MAPTFIVSHARCEYTAAVKIVATYKNGQTTKDMYEEIHLEWDQKKFTVECHGTIHGGSGGEREWRRRYSHRLGLAVRGSQRPRIYLPRLSLQ